MKNFSALVISTLLTAPGDAKADNFIIQFKQNEKREVISSKLVSIDNDHSFAKSKLGYKINAGKVKLYSDVLNVLYLMP
jgi:hypothetical protein